MGDSSNSFRELYLQSCVECGLDSKYHLNSSPFLAFLNQQRIDVKCDKITSTEWNPVFSALKKDKHLGLLDTRPNHQQHGEKGIAIQSVGVSTRLGRALGSCLTHSCDLKVLEFERFSFSSDCLSYLAKGIAESRSLLVLTLHDCPISDDGLTGILEGLKRNTTIVRLEMSDCKLTDKSAIRIQQLIKHRRTTEDSDLWKKNLRKNNKEFATLANDKSRGLSGLILSGNRFTDVGAKAVADALRSDAHIIELDLSRNFIKMEGAHALKEMFKYNQTLCKLNLKNNKGIDVNILAQIKSAAAVNGDPHTIKDIVKLEHNEYVPKPTIGTPKPKSKPAKLSVSSQLTAASSQAQADILKTSNNDTLEFGQSIGPQSPVTIKRLSIGYRTPSKKMVTAEKEDTEDAASWDGKLDIQEDSLYEMTVDKCKQMIEELQWQLRYENKLRFECESENLTLKGQNNELKKQLELLTIAKKRKTAVGDSQGQLSQSQVPTIIVAPISNMNDSAEPLRAQRTIFPTAESTDKRRKFQEELTVTDLGDENSGGSMASQQNELKLLEALESTLQQFNKMIDSFENSALRNSLQQSWQPPGQPALSHEMQEPKHVTSHVRFSQESAPNYAAAENWDYDNDFSNENSNSNNAAGYSSIYDQDLTQYSDYNSALESEPIDVEEYNYTAIRNKHLEDEYLSHSGPQSVSSLHSPSSARQSALTGSRFDSKLRTKSPTPQRKKINIHPAVSKKDKMIDEERRTIIAQRLKNMFHLGAQQIASGK